MNDITLTSKYSAYVRPAGVFTHFIKPDQRLNNKYSQELRVIGEAESKVASLIESLYDGVVTEAGCDVSEGVRSQVAESLIRADRPELNKRVYEFHRKAFDELTPMAEIVAEILASRDVEKAIEIHHLVLSNDFGCIQGKLTSITYSFNILDEELMESVNLGGRALGELLEDTLSDDSTALLAFMKKAAEKPNKTLKLLPCFDYKK